jgi:hypothetical protein
MANDGPTRTTATTINATVMDGYARVFSSAADRPSIHDLYDALRPRVPDVYHTNLLAALEAYSTRHIDMAQLETALLMFAPRDVLRLAVDHMLIQAIARSFVQGSLE